MNLAYAMGAGGGQGGPGGAGSIAGFLPLILIFVVFYFLLIRPQQKKTKEHREMLSKLTKGDAVVTAGGIHGRIVGLTEGLVTLEVAEKVRIKIDRSQIGRPKVAADKTGSTGS